MNLNGPPEFTNLDTDDQHACRLNLKPWWDCLLRMNAHFLKLHIAGKPFADADMMGVLSDEWSKSMDAVQFDQTLPPMAIERSYVVAGSKV